MGNNYSPLEKRVREIKSEVDEVNEQLDTIKNDIKIIDTVTKEEYHLGIENGAIFLERVVK